MLTRSREQTLPFLLSAIIYNFCSVGVFDLYFHTEGVLPEDKVLKEAAGNLDSRPGCDTTLTDVWPRESRTFGSVLLLINCEKTAKRR